MKIESSPSTDPNRLTPLPSLRGHAEHTHTNWAPDTEEEEEERV